MSAKAREQSKPSSVVELKADSFTLPVLKLLTPDIGVILDQLAEKVDQAPEFFRNAPLAVDLTEVTESKSSLDLESLVQKIRDMGISPIGIRGGNQSLQSQAQTCGLAVLSEGRKSQKPVHQEDSEPVKVSESDAPPRVTGPSDSEAVGAMLITQPVRSGQRIYAKDCDLIVLATVSAGAELIADGNIHVYGTLRGRALAGVNGDTNSRIFCQDLQAELVSISGQYQISEGISESLQGKPVQVYLSDETLLIDDL